MYFNLWDKIPKIWKNTTIQPLLKKEKGRKRCQELQVAITNVFYKYFEKMTNKRLVWLLEKERKIDNRQFGFRKQRSTIDAISITKILNGFTRREKITAIFFKIKKAYNKVSERRHLNN